MARVRVPCREAGLVDFDVLGPLVVRRDGVPVTLGTPKQRALLILLVLQAGRVVSLSRLIEGLWAEDPPPHARVTLRSYVSNVRRSLEAPGEAPVIQTRGSGYVLDVPAEAIDARRFAELARAGQEQLAAGDYERGLRTLDDALALWRGPALADVAEDDFARGEIARLEESRAICQEDRFDALLHLGRHAEAVAGLDAHIAERPLRERAHGQLMLALYRSGRAPEALGVYRRFRDHLVDELGLDPSPSLQQLADRMLHQAADLDPAPRAGSGQPSRPVSPPEADAGPPLVGREHEQQALRRAVDRLITGAGGLLLLAGEPGIGKTALLEDLAARARRAGMAVSWGRCPQGEGAPPFWPWRQILRGVSEGLTDDALRQATAGAAAGVQHVSAEIADRLGGRVTPQAGDYETARFQIYDAITTFLLRASGDGMVLLLDDLQWADPPSLQLLSFVTAQLSSSRLLIAASYRDLLAERSAELDATLATVAREPAVNHLSLSGIAPDDVAALAAHVVGRSPPEDLVAVLHERTGGNPFFLRQLTPLLLDEQAQAWSSPITAIPTRVRHVLTRRVAELPPATRRILDVAAVSGVQFDVRVLAAADDRELDDVIAALEAARDHGLVEATGRSVTGYRFVHTLVRETLYEAMTPARAARLHASVGAALQRTGRGSIDELAGHFWRAADLLDDDRPVRYLVAAADEALQHLAHERAETWLRRAHQALQGRKDPDRAVEFDILSRLCRLDIAIHGWSSPTLGGAVARLRELADPAAGGPGLGALGRLVWAFYFYRGEFDTAREVVKELTAQGERTGDAVGGATALLGRAFFLLYEPGHAGRAVQELAEARALADRAEPDRLAEMPEHLGVAIRGMEALARAIGGLPGALQAADDAVALADRLGRPFPRVYARLHGSWAGVGANDPRRVLELAQQGLDLCEEFGFPHIAELVTLPHAWAAAMLGGDPSAAATRITDALASLRAGGDTVNEFLGMGLLSEIRLKAGDRAGARDALHRARAMPAVYAGHLDLIAGRLERQLRTIAPA